MHYADGTPAKAGDLVLNNQKYSDTQGQQTVASANAGADTCNGNVSVVVRRALSTAGWGPWLPITGLQNDWSVTLKQCMKVEWNDLAVGSALQSS